MGLANQGIGVCDDESQSVDNRFVHCCLLEGFGIRAVYRSIAKKSLDFRSWCSSSFASEFSVFGVNLMSTVIASAVRGKCQISLKITPVDGVWIYDATFCGV